MLAYKAKWLPQSELTEETLAQALFLENDNAQNLKYAVANGISLILPDT